MDAHIIWTFRNELEPRWSYVQSYDAGWIKQEREFEAIPSDLKLNNPNLINFNIYFALKASE